MRGNEILSCGYEISTVSRGHEIKQVQHATYLVPTTYLRYDIRIRYVIVCVRYLLVGTIYYVVRTRYLVVATTNVSCWDETHKSWE